MGICVNNAQKTTQKRKNNNKNITQQKNNTKIKEELCVDNTPISLNLTDEIKKSICKIKITSKSYGLDSL